MQPSKSPAQAPAATKNEKPAPQSETPLLDKILDQEFTFEPFLAKENITLTPRRVVEFLAKPTKAGHRCTVQQALKFIMLCKARGLNPWEGDAFIVGFDSQDGPEFSLITAHQAFLKRAEVHVEYDGMESGVIVVDGGQVKEIEGDYHTEQQVVVGGWARVHFKNRKYPMYKRLRLATYNKGFGYWKVNPAGQIVKCAEADALRSAFPNSLGGMYLAEEFSPFDEDREPKKVEPLPVGKVDLRKPKENGTPAAPAPQQPVQQTQPEPTKEPTPTHPAQQSAPESDATHTPSPDDPAERTRDDVLEELQETIAEAREAGILDDKGKVLKSMLEKYKVRNCGSLATEQALELNRSLQIELDDKRQQQQGDAHEPEPPNGQLFEQPTDPREAQKR